MERKKRNKSRKIIIAITTGILLFMAVLIIGYCLLFKKHDKISYGDKLGVATGKVDFLGDTPEINIDNIKASPGTDIDYTSFLDIEGAKDDYSVSVNATGVNLDKKGTYNVFYKFKNGDKTYTDNVKVTITGQESKETYKEENDNVISSEEGNTSNIEMQHSANKGELITDKNAKGWSDEDIPNAVIELLSGDYVTISCTTSKYITATRTDTSEVERNGNRYKVSKLVIIFNTSQQQVLETIEKKID